MRLFGLKKCFPYTIPVMAGYLSLGIAYGVLMQKNGFGIVWTLMASLFIFAASAQFLCVGLLAGGATLAQTALLTFTLNFRHFFYGLSMISKYRMKGFKKLFLIFTLTDETYAILSTNEPPDVVGSEEFFLWVSALNYFYWVVGSAVGCTIGKLITVNTEGIDFAMTALFAVLFVEQWKTHRDHRAQLIGLGVILIVLFGFGADSFLIPGLIIISAVLVAVDFLDRRKGAERI